MGPFDEPPDERDRRDGRDESELPTLRAMGEHFQHAAEDDFRRMHGRRRARRLRGWMVAAVLTAAGAGGVAVATELIAIGTPQQDSADKDARYRPIARGVLDVTAPDKPLRWGVEVYRSRGGQSCAIVGQLRGSALGTIESGTFRPYSAGTATTCIGESNSFRYTVQSYPDRTVVYGISRAPVAKIELIRGGRSDQAVVGPRGAFLFVLTEDRRLGTFQVVARRADGRVVR